MYARRIHDHLLLGLPPLNHGKDIPRRDRRLRTARPCRLVRPRVRNVPHREEVRVPGVLELQRRAHPDEAVLGIHQRAAAVLICGGRGGWAEAARGDKMAVGSLADGGDDQVCCEGSAVL